MWIQWNPAMFNHKYLLLCHKQNIFTCAIAALSRNAVHGLNVIGFLLFMTSKSHKVRQIFVQFKNKRFHHLFCDDSCLSGVNRNEKWTGLQITKYLSSSLGLLEQLPVCSQNVTSQEREANRTVIFFSMAR